MHTPTPASRQFDHPPDTDVAPVRRSIHTPVSAGRTPPATANGSASFETITSPCTSTLLLFNGTLRTTIVWPCPEPMRSNLPSLASPGDAVVASYRNCHTCVGRQKNLPGLGMVAAPDGGPSGQLKPKQLMLGSEHAPVNNARIVENDDRTYRREAAGTAL
jgi:hypothetical protein